MIDKIPFILVAVGKPNSGKSHLLKYLAYEMIESGKMDSIYLFGGSVLSGNYDYLPEGYYGNYNEEEFKNILLWQIERVEKGEAKNIMIVFDDVMNLVNQFKSNLFRKIISEFRHYKISFVFSLQYLKSVPPLMRECSTHCVLFRTGNKLSLDAIHENFMNEMKNSKEVREFINKITKEKYSFLFIDLLEDDSKKYFPGKCCAELPEHRLNY